MYIGGLTQDSDQRFEGLKPGVVLVQNLFIHFRCSRQVIETVVNNGRHAHEPFGLFVVCFLQISELLEVCKRFLKAPLIRVNLHQA